MRYASCTITWMFKYIPYPDLLTDLSEKYIRLVVHILVLIHRVRVSDSGTNYSKFSQGAVKRGVHSLHKEVPLWLGIVDGINNSTHCMLLCCAYLRGGTHSEWVPPLRWNPICHGKKAEPRNSVLCPSRRGGTHSEWVPPSDGIQSIMAKKQEPEILGCAPLRGGTHSILAYSMPVLSRKIVEYVSSLFFLFFSSPSGVFLS